MNMLFNWGPRLVLAVMFFAMAVPKFLAPDITVHIFTELGVEPWGRLLTGVIEVVVAVMLLFPKSFKAGVAGSLIVLLGAIISHLFVIGVVISNQSGEINDGGSTFVTAIIMLALTLLCIKQVSKKAQ